MLHTKLQEKREYLMYKMVEKHKMVQMLQRKVQSFTFYYKVLLQKQS